MLGRNWRIFESSEWKDISSDAMEAFPLSLLVEAVDKIYVHILAYGPLWS